MINTAKVGDLRWEMVEDLRKRYRDLCAYHDQVDYFYLASAEKTFRKMLRIAAEIAGLEDEVHFLDVDTFDKRVLACKHALQGMIDAARVLKRRNRDLGLR